MSTISSIVDVGLDKASVVLSATPDSAPVDNWTAVPVTPLAVASCVYHVKRVGAACTVYFSPPLSPSCTYTLGVTTTTATVPAASVLNFATPATNKPLGAEWTHGLLRAWSRAITQTVGEFSGVPTTVLTQDVQPAETSVFVESTLGFPPAAYLFIGPDRYRYKSRGPACFVSVTRDAGTVYTEPRRQVVALDVYEVWPAGGMRYLTVTGRQYTDPNGVF